MKQDKFTKSARGQQCQIRVPDTCNFDPETTVLCHLNGAGMATKHDSRHGAFGCSACHDAVDGRVRTQFSRDELRLMHLDGVIRTQKLWIKWGLM